MTIITWLGLANLMSAAELQLANGDILTGEILDQKDGKIRFRSPVLGELVIAESQATVVPEPETPVESLAGLPPKIELVDLRDAEAVRPAKTDRKVDKAWKGKVEFGFNNQTGRKEATNLSLRGEAQYTKAANNYRINARYLYGESDGVISSDRRDSSFRWRRELSQRLFSQVVTSYFSDRVTNVDLNVEQNVGLGYKILQTERSTGSLGGGLTAQYREATGIEGGASVLGEFFQDYAYKINGRLTLSQDLNALFSPDPRHRTVTTASSKISDEADNYKIRFNSTLQGKLSERISLNLRYEYEYDNAILDKTNRTDQRVTSSLGYSF